MPPAPVKTSTVPRKRYRALSQGRQNLGESSSQWECHPSRYQYSYWEIELEKASSGLSLCVCMCACARTHGSGDAVPCVPSGKGGNAGLLPGPLPPPRLCLPRPGLLWVPRRVPGCFRAGKGCPKQRLWALGVSSAPHVTPWGKRSDDAVTKGDWQGRAGTSGAQGTAPASLRPDSSCPGL